MAMHTWYWTNFQLSLSNTRGILRRCDISRTSSDWRRIPSGMPRWSAEDPTSCMISTTRAIEGTGLGYWDDWTITKSPMQHLSSLARKTDSLVLRRWLLWVDSDVVRSLGSLCPVSVSWKGHGFCWSDLHSPDDPLRLIIDSMKRESIRTKSLRVGFGCWEAERRESRTWRCHKLLWARPYCGPIMCMLRDRNGICRVGMWVSLWLFRVFRDEKSATEKVSHLIPLCESPSDILRRCLAVAVDTFCMDNGIEWFKSFSRK